ncbi:pleckstrin homology domain-containing family G member 4B-like isoform X1 [Scleropages formosus]|uniref:pleckstrin homology domain-containing family G member 4B-like isoform X1 n=1 Tax=Scleropages formosus TaxID=113540 RepID=UPI0010FA919C|nr:pleckstrin homology domain-containing family G member 4B-like isoform X1 [Scleropages formosus]
MNPDSLDSSIQGALAALYPPFEATAPTVLSQLFRVIEERYRGDALQCLLDFLIPAKHILESVQQAACATYSDVLFRCEGWPLCLREKVVIQLASINPLLLHPGDFYLQVEPFADQAARIVLKSLLEEYRQIEEMPLPETSYPCIFTEEWLRCINEGRHGTPLRRCLLSTDQGIVKVPWAQVAKPEFVDKPKATTSSPMPLESSTSYPQGPHCPSAFSVETRILPAKDGIAVSLRLVDSGCSQLIKVNQCKPAGKPVGWVAPNTWDSHSDRELEGDYVDLVEFTKEKEALAFDRGLPLQKLPALRPVRPAPPVPCRDSTHPSPPTQSQDPEPCGHTLRFSKEPCTPCLTRRLAESCRLKEPRCRYRESYLEALQNPVSFEKGGTLAILEESSTNETDSASPASESEPPPYCHALHCCPELVEDQGPCLPGVENTSPDQQSRNSHPGRVLSHSCSSVSETYRKSPAMQAQAKRSISDVCPEMIPRVHVMQCKKGSAFGLMSPKTDKRRSIKQDVTQSSKAETPSSLPVVNGHQKKLLTAQADKSSESLVFSPSSQLSLFPANSSSALLHLGIACLPGSRDRNGRAVVELYGDHQGWRSPLVTSQELCKLLLYFHSIPRREVGDLGMTLVTDARKMPPPPTFYKALLLMQEQALNAVHCVLLLVDKEISPRPEKQPGLQMEIMTSLKALHKVVEGHQLTTNLEGTFPYSHVDWLQLHQKLNPFMLDLRDAASLLQNAIQKFEGNQKVDTAKDAQQRIHAQKTLMKEVLEDTQLVALQREGGAMLARLRREESRFAHSEDYRDYMDAVSSLYNVVEERVHMLVRSSNQSLQHLEFLLKLRELEEKFNKIQQWFSAEGERRLLEAESVEDSLERVEQTLQSFNSFLIQATEQKHQAMTLVTEAEAIQGSSYAETEIFRTMVYTFKSGLADFLSRAEQCRGELETMVNLCRFCEKATELAKDCREYLEQIKSHSQLNKEDLVNLKKYREQFSEYSVEFFQEIKAQACALKGSRGMRIWNVAWLRCQEVHQLLEERLHSSVKVKQPLEIPAGQEPKDGLESPLSALSTCVITSPPKASLCDSDRSSAEPVEVSMTEEGVTEQAVSSGAVHSVVESGEMNPTTGAEHITTRGAETDSTPMGPSGCEWFPWHQGLGRSLSEGSNRGSILTELQRHNPSHSHNQPSCQMLQAAQHFQVSRHGSFCSEDSGCGPGACSLDTETLDLSSGHNLMSEGTTSLNGGEAKAHFLRLQRIVEELLVTEREYVRSLGYILDHYYPLLERPDVPQDLRGQRGRVFGNLEKLHDFHHHCFLKELEGCLQEPVHVGRCFLKHRESFHLYALYSKNKPQSDSLLIHHSHDFFQKKQREMGDNMDLSSYLLKPVQRISKYNLLLQDMLKECEALHGSERARIQAALEMVRFQLRHGNDLLAMDDIQDCDVNLKEQGQLICQDEFLVSFRKKKCFRHIFLFQDLILFSKTKKTAVGNDIYIYKQSFKTSDIGMTHNSGDSGLCFEIWFRRRKSQDTYILQAKSAEVKEVWTRDLGQILWEQAVRNRELRMQERVFMGMGSKPFMDIQPSEAAICDRAVKCTLTGRVLQEEVVLSRPNSISSGSSGSASDSNSSSSSGRGSLPPTGYLCSHAQEPESHQEISTGAVKEDDVEIESVNLLMDSSESSGESVSGFSGSDRSCQSVTGGEADDTSSISSSLCSKTHGKPLYFRERVSPVVSRRRPLTTPIPQALNSPQGSGKVQAMAPARKSTEV